MDKGHVLSFSKDQETLAKRESARCNGGFFVVSVASEAQARFEIVMGLCGVLLICHRTNPTVAQELANLFKQSCPEGRIVFIMDRAPEGAPRGVDYIIAEATGAEAIVRLPNRWLMKYRVSDNVGGVKQFSSALARFVIQAVNE